MKNSKRMTIKQFFITILLCLAMFVVYMLGMLAVSVSQQMAIVLHSGICALLCGPIYVLLISKSRVYGTLFIFNAFFALFYLAAGNIYLSLLMLAVGLICELTLMNGGYQSQNRQVIPYILTWVAVGLKNIFMFALFHDALLSTYMKAGMDEATALIAIENASAVMLSVPLNVAGVAVTVVGGLVGFWLGKKAMKKYFITAGVASENEG